MILNEHEVRGAWHLWKDDPILGPASTTLTNLMNWTNENSDGWPYWRKPAAASRNLQQLLQQAKTQYLDTGEHTIAASEVRRAYGSIKRFLTQQGAPAEIVVACPRPPSEAGVLPAWTPVHSSGEAVDLLGALEASIERANAVLEQTRRLQQADRFASLYRVDL